jgi:predicted adenine nucleotide alpha hydrolase (AANH) superfamily ATPase
MDRIRSKGALLKILLHVCCAPCTIYPLRILREEGNGVCGLFFNPNIHPYLEYRRRLDTVISYAASEGLAVIREEDYPMEAFLRQVAFREEERCQYCYRIRLSQAAQIAKEGRFDAFTTTLLYSRHQKHDLIREVAEEVAGTLGVPFLYRDFREGWSEGVRVSKEKGIYRQPYCGCIFSEKARYCHNPGMGEGGGSTG